jgi:uncharacterized repeat protein (TIGR04076 family)
MDLVIRVRQIKGNCPVYEVGDSFTLKDGYRLSAGKPICMHSLASLMPYYNALRVSEPCQWGLAAKDDESKLVFQCSDPADHTGGGTVTFEVSKTL